MIRQQTTTNQQSRRSKTALSLALGLVLGGAGIGYGVLRHRSQAPVVAPAGAGQAARGHAEAPQPKDDRWEPGAHHGAPTEPGPGTEPAGAGGHDPAATPAGEPATPASAPAESPAREAIAVNSGEAIAVNSGEGKGPEGKSDGKGDSKGQAQTAMIKMEPLVANLDEGDQLRYLKVSLTLEVTAEGQQKAQMNLPRARHESLMYMSGLHLSDTQGLLGKQRIHREITRRIADSLGGGLKRVYFDEFIVQ